MQLLDKKEAAAALRQCQRTIDHLRESGQLPCVRIGRRVLFREVDLLEFVQNRIVKVTATKPRKPTVTKGTSV